MCWEVVMKKIRCFILSFFVVLCVGAVLCCCSPDVKSDDMIADDNEEVVLDDFSYIKQAYENTLNYKGSYMANITGENNGSASNAFSYYDVQTESLYSSLPHFVKIYKNNNSYYEYSDGAYTELHPAQAKQIFDDNIFKNVFSAGRFFTFDGAFFADDINQLKSACVTLCKAFAEKYDSEYVEPTVEIKKEDNRYMLDIWFALSADGRDINSFSAAMSIVACDSKIIEVQIRHDIEAENTTTTTMSICKFVYEFDRENVKEYDAEIDEKKSEVKSIDYSAVDIELYVEGCDITVHNEPIRAKSVSEAFYNLVRGVDSEVRVTDGWYTDKACTKRFNPEKTSPEEWFNLSALYAKGVCADLNDAFVYYGTYLNFDKLPQEYKIIYSSRNTPISGGAARRTSGKYELDDYGEKCDIYVNGKLIANNAKTIDIESGKLYYIEYRIYDPMQIIR